MTEELQRLEVIPDKNWWGEPTAWVALRNECRRGCNGLRWSPTRINEVNQRVEVVPGMNCEGEATTPDDPRQESMSGINGPGW